MKGVPNAARRILAELTDQTRKAAIMPYIIGPRCILPSHPQLFSISFREPASPVQRTWADSVWFEEKRSSSPHPLLGSVKPEARATPTEKAHLHPWVKRASLPGKRRSKRGSTGSHACNSLASVEPRRAKSSRHKCQSNRHYIERSCLPAGARAERDRRSVVLN